VRKLDAHLESSPHAVDGVLYLGTDTTNLVALDEKTGKVEWSFDTGDYVYGSPAVARVPGTPPTVYIGAENGRFFALDAHRQARPPPRAGRLHADGLRRQAPLPRRLLRPDRTGTDQALNERWASSPP
jgi:outer membrane protein assembly factor BamB